MAGDSAHSRYFEPERTVVKVTADEHPTLDQALAAVNASIAATKATLAAEAAARTCAYQADQAAGRLHDATSGNAALASAEQAQAQAETARAVAIAATNQAEIILAAAKHFEELVEEVGPAKTRARQANAAARAAAEATEAAFASAAIARQHTLANRQHVEIGIANRLRIDQGRSMRRTITWLLGIILAVIILCVLSLKLLAFVFPAENIPH